MRKRLDKQQYMKYYRIRGVKINFAYRQFILVGYMLTDSNGILVQTIGNDTAGWHTNPSINLATGRVFFSSRHDWLTNRFLYLNISPRAYFEIHERLKNGNKEPYNLS